MPWFANDRFDDHDEADPASELTIPDSSYDLADLAGLRSADEPTEPSSWQQSETASPSLPRARPTRRLSTPLLPWLPSEPEAEGWQPPPPPPQQSRARGWLPLGTFLLGMLCGACALLVTLFLFLGADRPPLASAPPDRSELVLQLSSAYLTALVTRSLPQVGLPGQVSHVRLTLQPGALIEVMGDETLTLLGVSVTRPLTLQIQPLTSACHLQVHLLHADWGGLPVTWLAAPLEARLNELLTRQPAPAGLPSGFRYCAVAARTTADALWITYSAEPTALRPLPADRRQALAL
uniref:Uncharacterized protein n=1 Tax=Thermogemmatispora argillosa TaxID=2045280 RepID=A0A455SXE9_9CHLR|nr:hypothetical protein KTA_00500 [Thermogemmatispora argillosa]